LFFPPKSLDIKPFAFFSSRSLGGENGFVLPPDAPDARLAPGDSLEAATGGAASAGAAPVGVAALVLSSGARSIIAQPLGYRR